MNNFLESLEKELDHGADCKCCGKVVGQIERFRLYHGDPVAKLRRHVEAKRALLVPFDGNKDEAMYADGKRDAFSDVLDAIVRLGL